MTTSRNLVELSKCIQNPKCCYDTHDLECPNKFNPPLLSSPTEFCTEALAKGIPIPRCVLAKPKKLQIDREPPPLAKPATSRHLKNWQRWCYIWRQTYNKLTAGRDTEVRPPVMSSGEVHRIKKEDKELFDRTLHTYHLTGFYVKNTQFPDSIRPKACGSSADIKEVVTKRHVRDFPEMKRQRYPNYVRNEISLPPRRSSTKVKGIIKQTQTRSPTGFNWEDQWAKSKHVDKMKELLACDIDLYGKTEPFPDNLIFKQLHLKDGPSERIFDKRNKEKGGKNGNMAVPQLVFSTDAAPQDKVGEARMSAESDGRSSSYYSEQRGPILRIRSQFSELLMTFSGTSGTDFPHFISKSLGSSDGDESAYFYDNDHHFSITTKCKETKIILLKNEGTTAIRYQWFRSPPTYDTEQMLQDPTNFRQIRLGPNDESQQEHDDLDSNSSNAGGSNQSASQSDGVPLNRVTKTMHLEFHFCSLPGIILPGQSLEFPIIFRSKRPGFFNETLYLLTHPRLVSFENGKSYSVRLSGVCTDVELAEKTNELYEMEDLKRFLSKKSMEEETMDLMDSILDRALWEATNITTSNSSLPNGRVTAESIFYAHNSDYYYHFGKSERAIELVRQLIEMLVPKERVETRAECDLSLQSMYNLVTSAREQDDLHWTQLRSSQCEDLLERLDTECMLTLREQRTFAWPNTERRKYTACYSNLVGTFDEILLGFDRLRNLYNAPAIKLIDQRKGEQMVEDYLLKEQEKQERMTMQVMDGSGGQVDGIFGETEVYNIPPVTEPRLNTAADTTDMAMDEEEEVEEIPYWLAAFEEMMSPYSLFDAQQKERTQKQQQQQQTGKEQSGQDQQEEYELRTAESPASGAGDAPAATLWSPPVSKGEKKRESTVLTLQETMQLQAKQTRQQVLTEARVKLFEELFCAGIQRMLATVDNFNNMLDYRDTDAIVVIDDKC